MLYDAVVVLASEAGAAQLATDATTKDFVSDAFAHCKFIGVVSTAEPLLDAAGVEPDDGVIPLEATKASVTAFVSRCGALRFWPREHTVHAT